MPVSDQSESSSAADASVDTIVVNVLPVDTTWHTHYIADSHEHEAVVPRGAPCQWHSKVDLIAVYDLIAY